MSYDHVLAGPVADIDEYHGGYRIGAQASSGRKLLNNKLLLADAGYISREYFVDVTKAKGSYLVRGSQNLNPSTGSFTDRTAGKCPSYSEKKAQGYRSEKPQSRGSGSGCGSSGKYKYRLIRRWFAEENGLYMDDQSSA